MEKIRLGCAICGSFCTYEPVLRELERLRGEFEQILAGDYGFLLRSPYPLCREFYIECICNMMRPRTIVDYEREPWVMDEGTVRITFDMNVRAAVGSFDIFDGAISDVRTICLPAL